VTSLADAPLVATGANSNARVHRGWIASPFFDASFLLAGPLIGLLTLIGVTEWSRGTLLIAILAYFVGFPHYLSTFVFFLGDDQRAHYFSRPAAFLAGPLLIIGAVVTFRVTQEYFVVLAVIYVWNIWHVALQSSGVVSLYRQLAGGSSREKVPSLVAIVTANAAMALWFADSFAPFTKFTGILHPHALRYIAIALAGVAVIAVVMLVLRLSERTRSVTAGEVVALISALALFHPYLWIRDLDVATFGMLIGHFVQYLALVWLIQARKYGVRSAGSVAQRALAFVSSRVWTVIAVILGLGMVMVLLTRGLERFGLHPRVVVVWNALALLHFYLDGLIWAFKRPFVRESLGPYVTVASHRIAA
jgi:hypothetical protein